ncbi:hypothetical protein GCM10020367_21020 [Streptomyces sannanensis]|uniref:Uncharacterized protein n=1 Tax=Streptomyces sannanensis TaxID=285536 RepID=A0ABP6SA83_9ACTN
MSVRERKIVYTVVAALISSCVGLVAAMLKLSEGAAFADCLVAAGVGFAGSMAVCLPVLMFLLA